ncbi:MAG: LysM domain-containing protein, partial [Woeseiaceae bacterium]|nr:LysM domain-containing protein [Woeseiaceae bacterium]
MQQFGDTAYVDILRNYKGRTFGFASRNFYVAFLAAMEVDQNAEKYFPGVRPESPTDYELITLPSYIAVADLSSALGVSPAQLAKSNPALQPTVWQGSKHVPRGFELRLPAASLDGSIDSLIARVPAERWASEQLPDLFHTVSRGDTLSQIAETYKTRVSTLVALNNLSSSHRIRIGQQIRLPAAGPAPALDPPPATQAAAVEAAVVARVEEPADVDAAVAEVTPAAFSGEVTSATRANLPTALLSDPSDYDVAEDLTIEVHPLETLGHYADWLGIRTQRLRDINGLAFRTPVTVGERIKLEFADVDVPTFESRRIAWHRAQQDEFFRAHVITGTTEHVIRRGESIWILSLRQYDVPVWLFRQYNPTLDLHKVRPGTTVKFPVLSSVDRS